MTPTKPKPKTKPKLPLLALAPAVVVVVGIAAAVAIALLGTAYLREQSDRSAQLRSRVLAQTLAARLSATPEEDRPALLERAAQRSGAELLLVEQNGAIAADATSGAPPGPRIVDLLVDGEGEARTELGKARFFAAPLAAPNEHLSLLALVSAPETPFASGSLLASVATLTTLLVGVATLVAFALTRDLDSDVRFVRERIVEMAHESMEPVGRHIPVRSVDQVGLLTSAFNMLVDRFTAAERAYRQDLAGAQAYDRDRTAFLAALSHELRTPLNAILGFTDVLLSEVDGPLSQDAHENLTVVRGSGQHLRALIDDILDLSALESGELRLESRVIDVFPVVAEVVRETEITAHAKNIAITINGKPATAYADPRRLRQIVGNLIGNAVKFTERGGVEVRVEPRDGGVAVSIRDTGPGIAPGEHEAIFQEYWQSLDAERRRTGTGLGLAITRRLVQMHRGFIDLRSELGVGSTFTVVLPARPPPPPPKVVEAQRPTLNSEVELGGQRMSAAATRLSPRVVGVELCFSLGSAALVGLLAPYFLLLSGPLAAQAAGALAVGLAGGGVAGTLYASLRLLRYRYLLRALAVGTNAVESHLLLRLSDEPKHLLIGWLLPSATGMVTSTLLLRPPIVDLTTGITLCLLGAVITAAASLPLFALVRAAFLAALELAPHEIMREVVDDAEREGRIGRRISRRMLAAVTTPVVFLAIGAALIVNAHVRRADERDREETARVFARAALEAGPGVVALAGIDAALEAGRALGFSAQRGTLPSGYSVTRGDDGVVSLRAPLDSGGAEVRFSGSTIGFLSLSSTVVALVAVALAAILGAELGTSLVTDLRNATRNVGALGTEVVVSGLTSGARIVRTARFRVIARLGLAVERLAQRFHVFAKAQERAIEARKAAARMRGLFFASVSHDLKSPLNAILGFTELVRKSEILTPGQLESLSVIDYRGRELLALIETILDAARVEAGQLKLVLDATDVPTLLNEATQKGRDLAADYEKPVVIEAAADLPELRIDRVRMPRAISTLVAHALRTTEAPTVRLSASVERGYLVRIEVELMDSRFSPSRLEAMLDPNRDPGASEHRGLSLGLRLARAVTELHGGEIEVSKKAQGGALSVLLPFRAPPLSQQPKRIRSPTWKQ